MLLGRLRIRGKLALLVIIPLLSMTALAVPVVLDRAQEARRAGEIADSARVANRVGTLVQDLQQERLLSIGHLLKLVPRTELVQKSATVADRIADIRYDLGDDLPAEVSDALDGVQKLADVRTAVLAGRADPQQIMAVFGSVDIALIDSLRLPFGVDTTTPAGRQVLALDALLRTDEKLSAGATLIVLVVATRSQQSSAAYIANMAGLQAENRLFRTLATPDQLTLALLEEAAVSTRTSQDFLSAGALDPAGAIAGVPLTTLFPSVVSMITLGQFVEKRVASDVITEVTDQQRRALTTAWAVGAVAVLILAIVMLLSAAVARTVARPLTRLTRSADRVARVAEAELVRVADDEAESVQPVRLDPVDVGARDEIGDLARAFERVQATAASLVERQVASRRNVAQMFGHVGRRTQNLVGRQIALIDQLEQQEADPVRLERLYRLDHISSRLRRNAGSLVVLSGSTGADGHVAPVPLADVVRLALGEIEDYTRVDVLVPLGVSVAPAAVGDLVLTFAELMENGTVFSPPHTRVVVNGELAEDGIRVNVVDHGIGMTEERLAEENARLTTRERLDLTPTEVLGLFVVGRLARRHGFGVSVAPTVGGGVTARVDLPQRLLVSRRTERAGVAPVRAAVPIAPPAALPQRPAAAPARPQQPSTASPVRAGAPTDPSVTAPAALAGALPQRDPGATTALRDGTTGAVPGPQPTGPGTEVGSVGPAGFDPVLLSRATRSLEAGESWNAFDTEPGTAADDEPTDGDPTGGTPTGLRTTAEASTSTSRNGRNPSSDPNRTGAPELGRRSAARAAGSTDGRPSGSLAGLVGRAGRRTPGPAHAAAEPVAATPVPGIRQRVPGAQLPPSGPAIRPDTSALDPAAARALVEEFESGVRRAEQNAPAARPQPVEVTAPSPRTGLSRRVPGANLSVAPTRQTISDHPGDPAEVRHQLTEFEAGVSRALREVSEASPDRRDEEGSTP